MAIQVVKKWQQDKIGNLLLKVKKQKKVKRGDYLESGLYPVVDQSDGLIGGYINNKEYLYSGGLPVIVFGDHTRRLKYINFPFAIGADGTQLLIPNDKFDRRFFYYALKEAPLANYGYQRHFKYLKDAEITYPTEKAVQSSISDILGSYEDFIENNTRQIKILEQMAQAIYAETFTTTTSKSTSLSEAIIIHRGKSYSGDELSETDGIPFVNLKCIDRDGGFRKSGLKRFTGKYKDTHKVIAGDIVMAVTDMTQDRRIVARAARVPTLEGGYGVISMDLVKIEPKDGNDKDYIYSLLRWSGFSDEVKNHANGANVLHLIPDRIMDYKIHIAPRDQQIGFGKKVKPIFDLIDKLELQNENLRRARDLLLPKLVTGEIKI